jgi:Zn-dependent metalloprotease
VVQKHAGQMTAAALETSATAALAKYGPASVLKTPAQELRLNSQSVTDGNHTLRYQQEFRGIPVMSGEMVVNSDAAGNILSLNGEVSPDLSLPSVSPVITAEQARSAALQGAHDWYSLDPGAIDSSQPQLWIYDERLLKPGSLPPVLVWRMELTASGATVPVRELVLVDANSGKILLHFNQIDTAWQQPQTEPTAQPIEPTVFATPTATEEPQIAPTETLTTIPPQKSQPLPTETPAGPVSPEGEVLPQAPHQPC